jgi:hypothetical protein
VYLVRENFHATIKCGGLSSQHSVRFPFVSHVLLLNFSVLARLLMGAISAMTVLRTRRRGTNTCYAAMDIVQERAERNSGLRRSLFKVNLFMNRSSRGKWQIRVVDIVGNSIIAACSLFPIPAICHPLVSLARIGPLNDLIYRETCMGDCDNWSHKTRCRLFVNGEQRFPGARLQ